MGIPFKAKNLNENKYITNIMKTSLKIFNEKLIDVF